MATPLSDERIAELTYRLKGPVTNPLDWWCEADDLFTIGRELLDEVERLRRLEEAVTTMPPDSRYTPQVAGRLLWHWEQGFRHDNHTQMVEWLAGIRRALEATDGDATE